MRLSVDVSTDKGKVSIHAPVKDATRLSDPEEKHINGFNPRTRKGCDSRQNKSRKS